MMNRAWGIATLPVLLAACTSNHSQAQRRYDVTPAQWHVQGNPPANATEIPIIIDVNQCSSASPPPTIDHVAIRTTERLIQLTVYIRTLRIPANQVCAGVQTSVAYRVQLGKAVGHRHIVP
jgi:hypothetical protein